MAETFIYISNAQDGDISGYRLDRASRTLVPVSRTKAAPMVMPLAIDQTRQMLYAAVRHAPYALLIYQIDPVTGRLKQLSSTPVENSLVNLRVSPEGRWLLAVSYGANLFAAIRLDAFGLPQREPASIVAGGQKPHDILFDADTGLAYVPYLGDDCIRAYRFDSLTGQFLTESIYELPAPPDSGPRHGVLAPNKRFLYVLNELLGTVMMFEKTSQDETFAEQQCVTSIPAEANMVPGRARPPSGVAPTPDDASPPDAIYCADIHMTPDGRFLYTSERTQGLLSHFSVDPANGRLEHVDTIATVAGPRSFAIDPRGDFLVVAGQKSTLVALYAIERNSGRLTLMQHIDGGRDANWVSIACFE